METVLKKLSTKYPDVTEVVAIYNDMLEKCKDCDKIEQKDKKYRPFPLLIGILYKAQQAARDPVKEGGVELQDTDNLMHLLGSYWHFIEIVCKTIRDGVNTIPPGEEGQKKLEEKLEINRFEAATKLDIDRNDLVRVWVSEITSLNAGGDHRLAAHCVDYTIHLDHLHQSLVLTIFGTRMFPRPNVHDIVMDLVGRHTQFLHGWAHEGMVTGCKTLQDNSMPHIQQALARFPTYSLLVVGYSLGAALAQLFTMDLLVGTTKQYLHANTVIRAITYGCPPIFTGDHIPEFNNILIVNNNHDGISGACIKNINEIFIKTGAIERLNLKRRILIQMLFYGKEEKYQDGSELGNMDDSISLNEVLMEDDELEQDNNGSQTVSKIKRVGSSSLSRIGSASKKALGNLVHNPEQENCNNNESVSMEDDQLEQDTTDSQTVSKIKRIGSTSLSRIGSASKKALGNLVHNPEEENWNNAESAIASVPATSDKFPQFRHVSKHILNIKRSNDQVCIKRFTGFHNTRIFSDEMRLKSGMFDAHMPWSYNALFKGFGDKEQAEKIPLQILDNLGDEMNGNFQPKHVDQPPKSRSIYPDLSEMQMM